MILNYLFFKKQKLNNMELNELLDSLRKQKKSIDFAILSTPSGEIRNKLTDINVMILDLMIDISNKIEDQK